MYLCICVFVYLYFEFCSEPFPCPYLHPWRQPHCHGLHSKASLSAKMWSVPQIYWTSFCLNIGLTSAQIFGFFAHQMFDFLLIKYGTFYWTEKWGQWNQLGLGVFCMLCIFAFFIFVFCLLCIFVFCRMRPVESVGAQCQTIKPWLGFVLCLFQFYKEYLLVYFRILQFCILWKIPQDRKHYKNWKTASNLNLNLNKCADICLVVFLGVHRARTK